MSAQREGSEEGSELKGSRAGERKCIGGLQPGPQADKQL